MLENNKEYKAWRRRKKMIIQKEKGKIIVSNINPIYSIADVDVLANVALYAESRGDAGVNVGLFGGVGGKLKDYTIGDIIPSITKYLPSFIRRINLPGFNAGIYTYTGRVENSYVFGFFNDIYDDNEGDYISIGVINRIKTRDGKKKREPFFSGRISLDGIFAHRNRENIVEGSEAKVQGS